MRALARVPRHLFVPEDLRRSAYVNKPLPIGCGQTVSQPYIVALMSDLLDLQAGDRVLEIGTGSGYQTAVLAALAARVYSIETVDKLARSAQALLCDQLQLDNVMLRHGDGALGWPEAAPFEAIMVTAAPPRFPEQLAAQLAPGGRLVVPIGRQGETQWLTVAHRDPGGNLRMEKLLPVAFVPLVS
ncbi:protein-L-isoaspartate(D-aspartate) O-methyltransferase [Magnetospira thiophila]